MNPPRILITGGAGRLAKPIASELKKRADVVLTDLHSCISTEKFLRADLMDFSQVFGLMHGIDTVVHLAVASSRKFSRANTLAEDELDPYHQLMLQVNPTSTYHVFEAARRAGVRRVIYSSSLTSYYGDKNRKRYLETDYPDPQNLYACTKLFGENLARIYVRDHGLEILSLRIGQPFPAHPDIDIKWQRDARARSSFVTLEDIARAVEAAVFSQEKQGVFNVVSDSDNPRFDLSASRRMGYIPSGRFTAEGLFHRNSESEEWRLKLPISKETT